MSSTSIRVLLVEDNPGDALLIRKMLAQASIPMFSVESADRLSSGLERLAERGADIVLLDLSLPDSQGLDTFRQVHELVPAMPIVVLSGLDAEALAIQSVRSGAQDYLVKGQVNRHLLTRALRYALERGEVEKERSELFAREKAARAEAEAAQQRLAKALQHERHIVRTLAESFLGRIPTLPGLQFAHIYEPASKTERMGGDYFDYIRVDCQRLALVIGDVCGKGLSAAVYTAMAKYMLRAYSKVEAEPGAVLARLNQALYEEMAEESMFITLFYGVLELGSFNLTYVNAGHPAPVLYHQESRQCERLEVTGGLVGAIPQLSYQQQTAQLAPGDILALFTDGVTEAARARGPEDDEGVALVLRKHAADAAGAIARAMLERANELAKGELEDDVAIVVVRR